MKPVFSPIRGKGDEASGASDVKIWLKYGVDAGLFNVQGLCGQAPDRHNTAGKL